jgi:hypothetical protein
VKKVIFLFAFLTVFVFMAFAFDVNNAGQAGSSAGGAVFPDNSVAYVNEMTGTCEIKRKGKEIMDEIQDLYVPLFEGDTIYTEDDSKLEIVFDDATIIKLDPNSKLLIKTLTRDNGKKTLLELIKGSVMAIVKKLAAHEEFGVKTKMAMAAVKGTEFIVTADDNSKVGVFDGTVAVTGYDMNGRELHRIMVERNHETVIEKNFGRPGEPILLGEVFRGKMNDIKDMRGRIVMMRQLQRSGKLRQYKLKHRLDRIHMLSRMKSNPEMRGKMTQRQKAFVEEQEKQEPYYRAQIDELDKKQDKEKHRMNNNRKDRE